VLESVVMVVLSAVPVKASSLPKLATVLLSVMVWVWSAPQNLVHVL
jgi:hypothetical protein